MDEAEAVAADDWAEEVAEDESEEDDNTVAVVVEELGATDVNCDGVDDAGDTDVEAAAERNGFPPVAVDVEVHAVPRGADHHGPTAGLTPYCTK